MWMRLKESAIGRISLVGISLVLLPVIIWAQQAPPGKDGQQTMSTTQEILARADSTFRSSQYAASRDIYLEALTSAEKDGNISDQVEALSMIARTYLILDDYATGFEWIQKAEKLADDSQPLGWSRYLGVRGRFYWQDGKLEQATRMFKDMYNYCSERELFDRAIDAAHMVAITGTFDEKIEWSHKGIKEAEAGNVTGWLGPLWNNLGANYEDNGDYQEALEAYTRARHYHWLYGNELNKMVADWAIGHINVLLHNYDEGVTWLRPVLAWCERIDNGEFIGLSCRDLGEVQFAKGEYKDAMDYFTRAETLLKEAGMDKWDADGFKKLTDRIKETEQKIK